MLFLNQNQMFLLVISHKTKTYSSSKPSFCANRHIKLHPLFMHLSFKMAPKTTAIVKCFITCCTIVWPFACVNTNMSPIIISMPIMINYVIYNDLFEYFTSPERLSTITAFKPFFTSMNQEVGFHVAPLRERFVTNIAFKVFLARM